MKTIVTLLFGAAIVFAWAPWMDNAYTYKQLEAASKQDGTCTFNDVISSKRLPFGYQAEVEYLCTASEEKMKRNVFVTSAGNVLPLSKLTKVSATE